MDLGPRKWVLFRFYPALTTFPNRGQISWGYLIEFSSPKVGVESHTVTRVYVKAFQLPINELQNYTVVSSKGV